MNDYGIVTEPDTVRFERLLPGPIERIWAYLTDADKRGVWLATGDMDLRVGGRVDLHFVHANLTPHDETPPAKYESCREAIDTVGHITRCEPPRVLAFTWNEGEEDSEVTFDLSPQGDEVLLVLTHRRLRDEQEKLSVSAGWHTHLGVLTDHLRGAVPKPFWATLVQLEADYARRFGVS